MPTMPSNTDLRYDLINLGQEKLLAAIAYYLTTIDMAELLMEQLPKSELVKIAKDTYDSE